MKPVSKTCSQVVLDDPVIQSLGGQRSSQLWMILTACPQSRRMMSLYGIENAIHAREDLLTFKTPTCVCSGSWRNAPSNGVLLPGRCSIGVLSEWVSEWVMQCWASTSASPAFFFFFFFFFLTARHTERAKFWCTEVRSELWQLSHALSLPLGMKCSFFVFKVEKVNIGEVARRARVCVCLSVCLSVCPLPAISQKPVKRQLSTLSRWLVQSWECIAYQFLLTWLSLKVIQFFFLLDSFGA